MAFCSQKPAAMSVARFCLSFFASLIWHSLPLCWHDCLSAQRYTGMGDVSFPRGLDEGWKSDELMNRWFNTLKAIEINAQHLFIKPLAKRKAMSGLCMLLFSSSISICWVFDEDVTICYSLCLYIPSSIHRNNKCYSCKLPCRIQQTCRQAPKCWIVEERR